MAVPRIRLSDLFEPSPFSSDVGPRSIGVDAKGNVDEVKDGLVTKQLSEPGADPNAALLKDSSPLALLPTSRASRDGVRGSWDSAEEAESPNSRERRLKLKVSRGALSKTRRQTGGASTVSFDSRRLSSEPSRSYDDDACLNNDGWLENNSFITGTPPAPPPSRCGGKYVNGVPRSAQKPAVRGEILALFSSRSRVNGKALRRLQKRFPGLENQLAELHLQMPEHPTATDTSGGERVVDVADANLVRKRRHRRLRGRVTTWISRARQAIARTHGRSRGGR
jgi:hypothetical protein